jgi:serine/threonine protein kinase/tetratricopeptide (TPR) repeat protein
MIMSELNFPISLGRYTLTKLIAKGGMGEVYLAFDPVCERHVALKKIRPELMKYPNSKARFLQEAKIAAKLSHPAIISIHDIVQNHEDLYYTMPFIEGESLKDILFKTIENFKTSTAPHPIGSSIYALSQIFLNVCQAIAFCHNAGILHRDIKPGNIMIGRFGQVQILDLGLAKAIADTSKEEEFEDSQTEDEDLTRPGKAVGTLSYLAPERALGHIASFQSDIYSLGVVLYQILTLKMPFKRQSLKDFKQTAKFEKLIDPVEMAPYRDIPIQLAGIAKKCLQPDPKLRYFTVEDLITDLKRFIEGRPDWIHQSTLSVNRSEDWEFQENVLLNKQLAITRSTYLMEWVALMISKASFSGNMKMVIRLTTEKNCQGIGFLFSIPEKAERTGLEDGFCLWAGTKKYPGFKLFRSNVELLSYPEIALKPQKSHEITIEKIEGRVQAYLDGESLLHYIGYIPIVGTHIGILSKDTDFTIDCLDVYTGSQNAWVNCLSIPDAFLACKEFKKAYLEYLRIAESFHGRQEGREALFRAGITLLEEAKTEKNHKAKLALCDLANNEFEKLKNTNGAPLEYLGKSLIYKFLQDIEEEIKCLELPLRKFPKNPILSLIKDEITFRLHESAKISRHHAYLFALLSSQHIPASQMQKETKTLLKNIHDHLDFLPFLQPLFEDANTSHLSISLAFWLNKPTTLLEIAAKKIHHVENRFSILKQIGFSLLFLQAHAYLDEFLALFNKEELNYDLTLETITKTLSILLDKTAFIEKITQMAQKEKLSEIDLLAIYYLVAYQAFDETEKTLEKAYEFLQTCQIDEKNDQLFDTICLNLLLRLNKLDESEQIFFQHATDLKMPLSLLYPLYGIYSFSQKNKEELIEEYKKLFQLPNPPITALFAHFISGYIDLKGTWFQKSFYFERIELYRQMELFYLVIGNKSKRSFFRKKLLMLLKNSSP